MIFLVLEDNPLDFRMVRQLIERSGLGEIQIFHCERLSEALKASDEQSPPDVILADLNLPDSSGLETVERMCDRFPQAALIVLSGPSDETLATLVVQAGAQDYLVKEQVNQESLRSAIRYALERKRIENELRRRAALERLAAEISTYFISPTLEGLDAQIDRALQNIGGFFGVERVVLLLFSADGVQVERSYEWRDKNLPAWGNSMTGRSTENVSWLMTRLKHNEPVYVTNIGDLPVEAGAERQMWHRAGIQSLVLVPVQSGNALIGNFGLADSRVGLSISENEIRFLRLISKVLVHAIEARRAAEAQRASDYAYRTLVEHSLQELLIFQDGRVVFANPIVSTNSGNTLAELLEMTTEEILAEQHPEDRPRIAELIKDLLSGKTSSQRIEYRRFNKDGSMSWMDALYTLIQYRGRPAIQVAQLGITERKLAEARLKHRLEMESLVTGISTRFIDLAVEEVDHEIKQALRVMGEFADVDRCYIYVLEQDEPRIIHEYCWQAPGVSQKSLEIAGLWLTSLPWLYERLQHKEFVHVFSLDDLPAEARAEKAFWGRQDVCSLLLVPLVRSGQLAGFLGMDMLRHERRWVDEDLTLLKLMSDVLSNALSAKWTEETLRKSESQYRLLADSIQDVIGLHKMDGTILFLSPSAEKVLGWKLAEYIGRNLFDEVARDNDPLLVQEARDRLSKGQDAVFEWRYQANGNFVWVETFAHPILEKGKEPEQWVSTSREITERRQARLALQNAHDRLKASMDGLQQCYRDSEMLLEMGDLLQSCLTVQDVCDVVKVFCQRFFPKSDGALYLLSSQLGMLECVVSWGEAVPIETNFPREECWAMRRGRPQTYRQTGTALPCRHVTRQAVDYLCAPLILQGEAAGLLHLRCNGSLDDRFQQLAAMIAGRVALAMTGIILRDTLRTQSIRDPLTGLFNRRYLMETMTREFSRASRRQHTVGVIMIDIDHFKQFNDTYGHDAGDALLQALSNFLLKNIRGEDLPCRYGGEEFILILPEATREDTIRRAEELRRGISGLKVVHKGVTLQDVTVSVGVAIYPEHGDTIEVVLKSVDLALYRAKQEGRNRIALPPVASLIG